MDPNETLRTLLNGLVLCSQGKRADYLQETIDGLESLAGWLRKGGFHPNVVREGLDAGRVTYSVKV